MSADISAARGLSAPETSEALWATDGLDLSTDESYAAGLGLPSRRPGPREMCAEHHGWRRLCGAHPMARHDHGLNVGLFRFLYLHYYTCSAPTPTVRPLPPDPKCIT